MGKTNAQEREALAKIREILEDFSPEDTYIGKAFEGCVEQAEENIRNDWMLSWKHRYEAKANSVEGILNANTELKRTLNQRDDAIARLEDAKDQLSEKLEETKKNEQVAIKEMNKWFKEYRSSTSTFKETWQKLEKAQTEIIELKAKLYDKLYDTKTREEVK
jgi:chromosome segregation ATPase